VEDGGNDWNLRGAWAAQEEKKKKAKKRKVA
jgi:hypothetical protein